MVVAVAAVAKAQACLLVTSVSAAGHKSAVAVVERVAEAHVMHTADAPDEDQTNSVLL